MTPYTPNDNFPVISIYDTNTAVLGGVGGDSNDPVKKLADRTEYLHNRLGKYLGHRIITTAASITNADKGLFIQAISTANISLSLDPVAGFKPGDFIEVKAKTTTNGKAIRLVPNGSETIKDSLFDYTPVGLYLHDGDTVRLIAGDSDGDNTPDYWEVIIIAGNFNKVGLDDLVRVRPANTVIPQGTIANRADFPRVWKAVEVDAISDTLWNSDPVRYRAMFSAGNGTTTFRWPDMRGLFHRALDLGRGLDVDRLDNVPGGFEFDEFKSHDHSNGNYNRLVQQNGFNTGTAFDNSPGEIDNRTGGVMASAGGFETRPKNAGFTPIIYY